MKFTVNKTIRIYGKKHDGKDGEAADQIPEGHEAEYHESPPAGVSSSDGGWGEEPPDTDRDMEDRKAREKWDKAPDFGELSISIQPGDERIGEIYFNVQYEGPNHQGDRCLDGLNEALPNVREWIESLLKDTTDSEMGGEETEIEMQLDSRPCPKGPHRIKVKSLVSREAEVKVIQGPKVIVSNQNTVGR